MDDFLLQSGTKRANNSPKFSFRKKLSSRDLSIDTHISEFSRMDNSHCIMYVKSMVLYVFDAMTTRTLDSN